jgi:tRNA A37 threonylcarbamoyladenosine modification protein TsaB
LKNQLTLKNINQLIVGAGPGSYTGIKVVDGFKQMAKVFGIKTFSYWSFEIPALSGNTFGAWLSTAYKKEVFIDTWKDNQTENHLIAIEMLDSFISNFRGELFASNDELEKNITEKKYSIVQTDVLIKKNPQMIFTQVVKLNLQRDLAYFRSLDKEYKTTQPQFARN